MTINKLRQPTKPGLPPLALPPPEGPKGLGLEEVFRALRRRQGLILLVTLLGTTLALSAGSLLTPEYTTTAEVMINLRDPGDDVFGDRSESNRNLVDRIQTEINLIRSGLLIDRVMSEMGLYADPAFQPDDMGAPGPILNR